MEIIEKLIFSSKHFINQINNDYLFLNNLTI